MLRLKLKVQTHKNNLQTLRLLPATQERLVMFLREHEALLPCVQEKISISQEKNKYTGERRVRVARGMADGCSTMESDTKRIWFWIFQHPWEKQIKR